MTSLREIRARGRDHKRFPDSTRSRTAMGNSKTCPKCKVSNVIHIPGDVRAYGAGNNITAGWSIFHAVKVARYVCGACGFIKEWIENSEDIAKLKKMYG